MFPLLVARGAKAAGRRVVCAAFAGHAWPDLRSECDRFEWVGVLRFGQWVRVLRAAGCDEAVVGLSNVSLMVGDVSTTPSPDRPAREAAATP